MLTSATAYLISPPVLDPVDDKRDEQERDTNREIGNDEQLTLNSRTGSAALALRSRYRGCGTGSSRKAEATLEADVRLFRPEKINEAL